MRKPIRSAFSVEGEGPPLFLIHGIGGSRHSWDGLVAGLKSEFRCISYDLRGHGKSLKPRCPIRSMISSTTSRRCAPSSALRGCISPAIRSVA
jgi:pimeloyl-ACP methyl ester carboxylesterase